MKPKKSSLTTTSSYLTAVIRRYGLTPEDTEDVLQNTLTKIWEIIPNFSYDNSKDRFRSWLTQVTINFMKRQVVTNSRLKKAFNAGKIQIDDRS